MEGTVIILRAGQGSGKSTLRKILIDKVHKRGLWIDSFRIADPLYKFQNTIERWKREVRYETIDESVEDDVPYDESFKNGPLLQDLGDLIRKNYGKILIEKVVKDIDHFTHWGGEVAVVEDCRLPEEERIIKLTSGSLGHKVIVIKLECSETTRKERAGSTWRPTDHITESALNGDGWENPDLVLNTETSDPAEVAAWVESEVIPRLSDKRSAIFERACQHFNKMLRGAEDDTGLGANFKWSYDKEGRKCLALDTTGPLVKHSREFVDSVLGEVPKVIKAAEKELGVSQDGAESKTDSEPGVNE